MPENSRPLLIAAGIGLVAGMRSMSALALVGSRLASRSTAILLKVMAAGEIVADKTPSIPSRTEPASIAGRLTFGGAAAGFVAWKMGDSIPAAVAVGAGTAFASTHLFYQLRKRAGEMTAIPDPLLGAAEDGIMLGIGSRVAALIPDR